MSRNLKMIIMLAAGILLLVAALVALSCDSCGEAPEALLSGSDVTSGSTVSDSNIHQGGSHLHHNDSSELLIDKDELKTLRLISNQGDFLIRRGEDGKLTIDSLAPLKVESDFLEVVWYNALAFGYSYTLHADEGTNLADFGLDPAVLTIECQYADGSSCRVFVGKQVVGSPNIYYFRLEGREEIFLNEFDAAYFLGESYWLSDDIFGDDVEDVTIGTIKLSGSAFPVEQTITVNSITDKSSPYYGYDRVFSAPFGGGADNYLTTLLTDELTELVADEAVCAFPSNEDIARYGLDRPYVIINHQRNGQWKTLRVARVDASTLYAKADGVECIFQLSADTFETIGSLSPDYLRTPEVHVRYFDSVETIRIQAENVDLTFRLERTPIPTNTSLYEYRAFYGDTQLVLNNYKYLLEAFNRAAAVNYGGEKESDTPAMTVTITFFEEFERDMEVIRYYPAGTRRYLAQIDGSGDTVVGQMWMDKLLESAKALAAGEEVTL